MESESNGKFEDTVSSESDSSRQKTKARQVVGNLNVTHGEDMKCVDIFGHSEGDDGLEVANDEDYCIEKDLLAEEARVRKFNSAKLEKDDKEEKAAAMAAAGEMTEEERYSKVMDLLKKSEFYSQYLLDKIENGELLHCRSNSFINLLCICRRRFQLP